MKKNKGLKNIMISLIIIIILFYLFVMNIPTLLITTSYSYRGSMLPTLSDHSVDLCVRNNDLLENVKRGSIIVTSGLIKNELLCKRIIGLPGDHIQINKDTYDVYINGELYNEYSGCHNITKDSTYKFSYQPGGKEYEYIIEDVIYTDIILKDNEYFVMGDNRAFSVDSKAKGPIKKTEIIAFSYPSAILNQTLSNHIKSYFEIYYKYLIGQSNTLKWGENYKPIALESDNSSIRIKHFIDEDTDKIYYQNDIYDIKEKSMK